MALNYSMGVYKSNFRFPWFCMLVEVEAGGNTCSLVAILHNNPLAVVLAGRRTYISFNPIPIVLETSTKRTAIRAREQETGSR